MQNQPEFRSGFRPSCDCQLVKLDAALLFDIWVFYGLMIAAVMVLRRTRPDLPRPYRMWGYPATPIAFLAITLWFLINMLMTRPGASYASLA